MLKKQRFVLMNTKGMSLLEVMVTLGIMSIIFLGIAHSMKSALKMQNYVTKQDDARLLTKQMDGDFSHPLKCMRTFSGVTLDRNILGIDSALQARSTNYRFFFGDLSNITGATNPTIGKAQVEWIGIQLVSQIATNSYRGNIVVGYQNDPNLSYNMSPKQIPIELNLNGNSIESCHTLADISGAGGSGGSAAGNQQILAQSCPAGHYISGIDSNGQIICSSFQDAGFQPTPSESTNNPPTPVITSSAPTNQYNITDWGCRNDNCVTTSQLPCFGNNCVTNGNFCAGDNCVAYGAGATCDGRNCRSGPQYSPYSVVSY